MTNLLEFFRNENNLLNISLGMKRGAVIDTLVPPEEIVQYGGQEMLHYSNGVMFRLINDEIIEFGIEFIRSADISYSINLHEVYDVKSITQDTKLHTIIRFLKYAKIPWHSYDEANLMSISVKTSNNLCFIFDPHDGEIARIVYRG